MGGGLVALLKLAFYFALVGAGVIALGQLAQVVMSKARAVL